MYRNNHIEFNLKQTENRQSFENILGIEMDEVPKSLPITQSFFNIFFYGSDRNKQLFAVFNKIIKYSGEY